MVEMDADVFAKDEEQLLHPSFRREAMRKGECVHGLSYFPRIRIHVGFPLLKMIRGRSAHPISVTDHMKHYLRIGGFRNGLLSLNHSCQELRIRRIEQGRCELEHIVAGNGVYIQSALCYVQVWWRG